MSRSAYNESYPEPDGRSGTHVPISDEKQDLEEAIAQLNLEPVPATFEKPADEKHKHLKDLFLKGFVDGKPVTKMLVDGRAAVNIMPYAMLRKLGKGSEDLTRQI